MTRCRRKKEQSKQQMLKKEEKIKPPDRNIKSKYVHWSFISWLLFHDTKLLFVISLFFLEMRSRKWSSIVSSIDQ